MNSLITILVNRFTKGGLWFIYALVLMSVIASTSYAWEIDLSRRRKAVAPNEATLPSKNADVGFLENILPAGQGSQEIVILSTDQGFIPKTIRVKKDQPYVIYVVNVNEKEKNVSFILDAFSEHHGTYFGKIQKFEITPKKEGVYSYQCPETSYEGRMVVFTGDPSSRQLSSKSGE